VLLSEVLKETAEYKNPQVLIPLATKNIVDLLLKYFRPRNLICMNTDRQELFEINGGCYRLPADFINPYGRKALVPGAFDLAYLPSSPAYWYLAYNYVRKGGYLVGNAAEDRRFKNWAKALGYENSVLAV
jgi:hypothetical protein